LDLPKAPGGLRKVLDSALQHRSHAHPVSRGIVVKGDGNLNQSSKKLFVFWRGGAPDVFEGFVGVEEFGFVKKANSVQVRIGIHPFIVAQAGGIAARET
jgi:hypothetical protein